MRKISVAILVFVVLSFVIACYAYGEIEGDVVASHWGANGEVDDYMSKFWGLFLLPLVSIGVYLLFLMIPMIDPLKNNIEKFRKYYELLMLAIILLLFYIFILTVVANFGYDFNMTVMIFPAIGLLFFGFGVIMKELKRNWFIGIRTPWTLSSDVVWKKTHELGGILFRVMGVLMFVGIFMPSEYIVWFVLVPVIIMVVWLFGYSYLEFRKIKR
jgi:uncharacterized membrane protein